MSEQVGKPAKRMRRHRYVVDFKQQARISMPFFLAVIALGVLNALAHTVLIGFGDIQEMEISEATDLLLAVDVLFIMLAAATVAVTGLAVSNRISGPARALRSAVQNLREGTLDRPIALEELRKDQVRNTEALRDLEACLEEGDVAAARELLFRITGRKVESAPVEQTV
jgi:HAMP domain-containing protein